jgi:ferredoxin-NADP reductase
LPDSENDIIVGAMAQPAAGVEQPPGHRDHGFHRVRVATVTAETPEASSFTLEVPDALRGDFAYRAGQFCTFRVPIDGDPQLRSYSMSSSPEIDDQLTVTVKRVPDGLVSNWMCDHLDVGSEVEVTFPAGVFCLTDDGGDLLCFAAGSGITPVMSLIDSALATTERRVRLLYANRDRASTIFAARIDDLAARHPDRLVVRHHLDAEHGFVVAADVLALAGDPDADAHAYVCGPGPFMDIVEDALLGAGVGPSRLHIERFTPSELLPDEPTAPDPNAGSAQPDGDSIVTIELDGRTEVADHRPGTTILQTARQMGMSPPFSCESGSCATCMGRLLEGSVSMRVNDALTDAEVGEGWILTCQSVPTSPTVRVIYGYD